MTTNFKPEYFKSAKYRKWIGTNPCYRCGKPFSVGHHLPRQDGRRRSGDDLMIPVCNVCHISLHAHPDKEKQELKRLIKIAEQLFTEWEGL